MPDTPEDTVERRLLIAEDTVLLTLDIVLEILLFTPFQAVVVTDLMPFHPVVTLDFRLLTADFVVLLMEFQALVRLLFTLFQALVV